MTTTEQAKRSRTKGKAAENAVAKYLRGHGWPQATRAVRTGYRTAERDMADPGDIAGCPGLVISVKDAHTERLGQWFAELDAMADPDDHVGGLGLLVVKRRQHASPGEWWCWLRLGTLHSITGQTSTHQAPVRMELSDLVPLLHRAGYGRAAA